MLRIFEYLCKVNAKRNRTMQKIKTLNGLFALSPIIVLLTVYLAGSMIAGDFYRIPIAVAFIIAAAYAIAISRGCLNERIDNFSKGAASTRIMYMIWIFVLAGAFAKITEAMGAIDATVTVARNAIPASYLPAGIFIASCFVSFSIGTSVGTIVALTPVVTALAGQIECSTAWMVAIVVGGSFFGDNLSFISDTTIAATQTQGCTMRSKFYSNIRVVMPAAIATLLIYAFNGNSIEAIEAPALDFTSVLKCLPYLIVIVVALCGVNVLLVLALGILSAAILGLAYGSFSGIGLFTHIGAGMMGMGELIIVTMLAGGLLELVRLNGGLDYLIQVTTARVKSKRGAEAAITALTALANVCTANNTIAILSVGGISRDIARQFNVSPRRSASLMDTSSCFVQGIIPYGAQLLMASSLTGALVSPVEIIPHLYYPMCVGAALVISIVIKRKKGQILP